MGVKGICRNGEVPFSFCQVPIELQLLWWGEFTESQQQLQPETLAVMFLVLLFPLKLHLDSERISSHVEAHSFNGRYTKCLL